MGDDAVESWLPWICQCVRILVLFTPSIVLDILIVNSKLINGDHSFLRVKCEEVEPTPEEFVFDVLLPEDLVATD